MPAMAAPISLISSVSAYVEAAGRRSSALQAYARWSASEPCLSRYRCLPDAVGACRSATPEDQDAVLCSLLAVATTEPLAQLAVIAALSRRLGSALSSWRRSGASPSDLQVLQADLVSECWATVAELAARLSAGEALPARLAVVIVDRARAAVRAPRRRELRARARQGPLGAALTAATVARPAAEALALEIRDAVRAGRISAKAAAPVFLTRVAGYSTAEAARALGRAPAVLRAQRSRAERALVA